MENRLDLSSSYAGRRTLVTGATGYIGARLCRKLDELGARVVAVSRNTPPRSHTDVPEGVEWRKADFEHPDALLRLMDDTEAELIFHCSGLAHGQQNLEHVLPTMYSNLVSTTNLLIAAAQHGSCPVVLAGSMEESTCPGDDKEPQSPYAASKEACDIYARLFRNLYDVPVINARIFMTYGPGLYKMDKLLPYTIMSLANGEAPRLGAGLRKIDWVYIDDVAEGLLRSAFAKGEHAKRVDIGSGKVVSIQNLVRKIARTMGSSVEIGFGSGDDRLGDQQELIADNHKTFEQLGWAPSMALERGLEKTVQWYCDRKEHFQHEWELLHNR